MKVLFFSSLLSAGSSPCCRYMPERTYILEYTVVVQKVLSDTLYFLTFADRRLEMVILMIRMMADGLDGLTNNNDITAFCVI